MSNRLLTAALLAIMITSRPVAAEDRHSFETEEGQATINDHECTFQSKSGDFMAVAGRHLTQVYTRGRMAIVYPNNRVQNVNAKYLNQAEEAEIASFARKAKAACNNKQPGHSAR